MSGYRRTGGRNPLWQVAGRGTGWRSTSALVMPVIGMLAYVTWPVLASGTSPGEQDRAAQYPAVLAATLALTALVMMAMWLDARRRLAVYAALPALIVIGVACKLLLTPQTGAIEPVFWVPMLAGTVLGAPGGWVAGVTIMTLSALLGGDLLGGSATVVVQILVAGVWGVAGGLLHRTRGSLAILLGAAAAVPLAVATGLLHNLPGWASDPGAQPPSIIGLGPAEQAQALWVYSTSVTAGADTVRGLTNAVFLVVAGTFLLSPLRAIAWSADVGSTANAKAPGAARGLSPAARDRRNRSARLADLWSDPTTEGKEGPDEHAGTAHRR